MYSNPVKLTFMNFSQNAFHIMFMEKIDEYSNLCDEELVMMHQINFPLTKIYTAYYDEHYLELNLIFAMLL